MEQSETGKRRVVHFEKGLCSEKEDEIAEETPLTIEVDGVEFATLVCTPTNLMDLVTGFLASEGVIRRHEEMDTLRIDKSRGYAYVELKVKKKFDMSLYSKRFIGSCCGKSQQFYLQNDVRTAKTAMTQLTVTPDQILSLMRKLTDTSDLFRQTGGVHNAALCTPGDMVLSRSDIGRHNALDKIYGYCLRNRIPVRDKIIAFSGRISSEVLLKVAKIGAGIVLSKSAPTTLALSLAEELGITAVGFIRGHSMNVYTHPERITIPDAD